MSSIHPTAVIEPGACLASDVEVGPFCVVGSQVTLKAGVRLMSHVVITGRMTLGERCTVYPFASLGHAPQDLKYKGEPSTVDVGHDTIIREYVTIQPGTAGDQMTTRVGHHCLLMAGVHVAHDCQIGNHVVMANNVTLGGHVHIGEYTVIGGLAAIHQFVRIGIHAMIGGTAGVTDDVAPYCIVVPGRKAHLEGLNLIGLKRRGFTSQDIQLLRDAYKHLFEAQHATFQERLNTLSPELGGHPLVEPFLAFLRERETRRPLCLPQRSFFAATDNAPFPSVASA